jgi:nitric oxide reductase large subunit
VLFPRVCLLCQFFFFSYQKAKAEAEEKIVKSVLKMLNIGMAIEEVADLLALPVKQVQAIKNKHIN